VRSLGTAVKLHEFPQILADEPQADFTPAIDAHTHSHVHTMSGNHPHPFIEGDRVIAPSRPGFPHGTILKLLDKGFLLVRWDGDVLETSYHGDLSKAESTNS
jgi:adenine/guanine phosphoribosyltransferase-like PRPP-binding protein